MTFITRIQDSLQNLVSGLGGSRDKAAANQFVFTEMGENELESMYRGDWMAAKAVDIPAFDSVREWRNWQADADQIEEIEAEEKRLNLRGKVKEAMIYGRLYGGAGLIMGIGTDDPAQPVNLDRIEANDLRYVHVMTRYELIASEMRRDPEDEWFGHPVHYQIQTTDGHQVLVHPSRVAIFTGNLAPNRARMTHPWGDSVLEKIREAVSNAARTSTAIAQLIEEAKIDVVRIPGLSETWLASEDTTSKLVSRFSSAMTLKSLTNALILDGEEEYEQKQVSFANLPETLQQYIQVVSGAADIPATRFLGQSPAGLNATGDSDLRNYYDRISAEQETTLTPALSPLDEVLIRSALGSRDEAVHYNWAPLYQSSAKELSEIEKNRAETFSKWATSGLVYDEVLGKVAENTMIESGQYPGLEAAIEEFGSKAEEYDPEAGNPNDPDDPDNPMAPEGEEPELDPETGEPVADADKGASAMKVGDLVEFNSDRQTEKGPSSGHVTQVKNGYVTISHSDHPGEKFKASELSVSSVGKGKGGKVLWHLDAAPRTLYVYRKVLNGKAIIAWAKRQGFKSTLKAGDLHVTIAFSRKPVDWIKAGTTWSDDQDGKLTVAPGGPRIVEPLGPKGAVVLHFASNQLIWRHEDIRHATGATWDYDEYQPHITITYEPGDVDLAKVKPFTGKIELGPEVFEELEASDL